jgi:hypothetical protein
MVRLAGFEPTTPWFVVFRSRVSCCFVWRQSRPFRRTLLCPAPTRSRQSPKSPPLTAAIALLLAGCATPTWYGEPHHVVPIRWVRVNEAPQSEVRDGVCVLYMPDTSSPRQVDRVAAEPLIERCIASGSLRAGAGDFDLHWYLVADAFESNRRYDDVAPRPGPPRPTAALKPSGRSNGLTDGFSERLGPVCRVVTHGSHRLGHELKHCYDGSWHP